MAKRTMPHSYDSSRIKREELIRLLISGVFSLLVAGLVIWATFALFPYTARLPKTVTVGGTAMPLDWSLLGNIASVVTVALVVGGLVFAVSQYIENADERRRGVAQAQFGMYKEVFDRLMSREAVQARRWIILNLPTLDQAGNDREAWLAQTRALVCAVPPGERTEWAPGKAHLKQVLTDFDFLGFVAQHYWSMENELVEWMSAPVAKVWERIYAYVDCEARERGEPDFYASAAWLGERCLSWRRGQGYQQSKIIEEAI